MGSAPGGPQAAADGRAVQKRKARERGQRRCGGGARTRGRGRRRRAGGGRAPPSPRCRRSSGDTQCARRRPAAAARRRPPSGTARRRRRRPGSRARRRGRRAPAGATQSPVGVGRVFCVPGVSCSLKGEGVDGSRRAGRGAAAGRKRRRKAGRQAPRNAARLDLLGAADGAQLQAVNPRLRRCWAAGSGGSGLRVCVFGW